MPRTLHEASSSKDGQQIFQEENCQELKDRLSPTGSAGDMPLDQLWSARTSLETQLGVSRSNLKNNTRQARTSAFSRSFGLAFYLFLPLNFFNFKFKINFLLIYKNKTK